MKVLLIDNYDSFVYNNAQYVGELGPDRLILSPGPGTPTDKRYFGNCMAIIRSARMPVLGVCLGHQGIAHAFGGEVIHASRLMHGKTSMVRHDGKGIFRGLPNPFEVGRYHSLAVNPFRIPPSLRVSAYSMDDCEVMAIRHASRRIDGIQFHPESIMTAQGKRLLKNFLDGS